MLQRVTLTANGNLSIQDFLGLQTYLPNHQFVSKGASFGDTIVFDVPDTTWDSVRDELVELSQRRMPAVDTLGVPLGTGKTMPVITYQVELIPGGRPRIHRVDTPDNGGGVASVSLGGGAQRIKLFGENLIAGLAAKATLTRFNPVASFAYPGTASFPLPVDVLQFVSTRKGPVGNLTQIVILPSAGSSSVATQVLADGVVVITITPLNGASTSTAIAALVAGNAVASVYVTATALVASAPVGPTSTPSYNLGASASGQGKALSLSTGDGTGVALLDTPALLGVAGFLRVVAVKAGNEQNLITLRLNVGQGGNSVAVTGTNIVVNRTEAAPTIANVVTAINGSAPAAALVTASSQGAAGTLPGFLPTWLYGGSGETPTAKVGGGVATVTAHSDIEIDLSITGAVVTAAGPIVTDDALVQVQMNYALLQARVTVIA